MEKWLAFMAGTGFGAAVSELLRPPAPPEKTASVVADASADGAHSHAARSVARMHAVMAEIRGLMRHRGSAAKTGAAVSISDRAQGRKPAGYPGYLRALALGIGAAAVGWGARKGGSAGSAAAAGGALLLLFESAREAELLGGEGAGVLEKVRRWGRDGLRSVDARSPGAAATP